MIPTALQHLTARIVLVAYLMATTVAGGWHDHRGCNSGDGAETCVGAECAGAACVADAAGEACHTHGRHTHVHKHTHPHHHGESASHGRHSHGAEEQGTDGVKLRAVHEHHCLVCQFLALTPLITEPPQLSGQLTLLPLAIQPILSVVEPPVCSQHPARGPPTS